jgi:Uncharacterized protein conserved in bacteria
MYMNMTANLMVESVDKAVAFYQEMLGFNVVTSVPGKNNELQFAILSKDKLLLMVQEKENMIEEYPVLKIENVHPSISLYITVDNFDELYRDMKNKTLINKELHKTFYGTREFAITDIDGYVLIFTEPVG